MEKRITFNFVNPPFKEHRKVFEAFMNKHTIGKGVDGIYHISKTKKEYLTFLKKLYIFMKDKDLLKEYTRIYGTRNKYFGYKIIFEVETIEKEILTDKNN